MKTFNVIIYDFNKKKFESYDIMPYLVRTWEEFVDKVIDFREETDNYWKLPTNFEEYKKWVKSRLQYQFWSRCEYELILSPWPPKENEEGEIILEESTAEKWDIYKQCEMNLDIITQIFTENIHENISNL